MGQTHAPAASGAFQRVLANATEAEWRAGGEGGRRVTAAEGPSRAARHAEGEGWLEDERPTWAMLACLAAGHEGQSGRGFRK